MKKRLNALCCGLTISRRPRQQPTSGAPGVIGGAGQAQGQRHDTAALPGFVSSLTAAAENRVAEVRASPAGQLATQTDIQIAAPITNEPAVSNADTGGHETAVIA
ncbi:MAG: hypothetical protein JWM42_4241, partial [Burkholderia sp.]|nr:hypothetical protein [Burkholderia sp.]